MISSYIGDKADALRNIHKEGIEIEVIQYHISAKY